MSAPAPAGRVCHDSHPVTDLCPDPFRVGRVRVVDASGGCRRAPPRLALLCRHRSHRQTRNGPRAGSLVAGPSEGDGHRPPRGPAQLVVCLGTALIENPALSPPAGATRCTRRKGWPAAVGARARARSRSWRPPGGEVACRGVGWPGCPDVVRWRVAPRRGRGRGSRPFDSPRIAFNQRSQRHDRAG